MPIGTNPSHGYPMGGRKNNFSRLATIGQIPFYAGRNPHIPRMFPVGVPAFLTLDLPTNPKLLLPTDRYTIARINQGHG